MVRIEEVRAWLADDVALTKLLAALPVPPSVRDLLWKPFFSRRWHAERECDYWLMSDGVKVVCLTISGADAALIARMRRGFDELSWEHPGLDPSRKVLRELLATMMREDHLVA